MSHRPRKRFSQNFLVDESAIAAIVAAIAPKIDDTMVEIGPGLGALTRPLSRVVRPLHVVEIDRDLAARLRAEYAGGTIHVHEGDALEFDLRSIGGDVRVVGNLPYHISTPLLFSFAAQAAVLRDVHVMLQSEVVERIVAAAGASDYGRLSVMLQYRFHIEKVLDVPASAFEPPPNVESAVIRMVPREAAELTAGREETLSETVAQAFSQRRKTLRNTLGRHLAPEDFAALDIDPQARAQNLTVADFVRIANYREERGG